MLLELKLSKYILIKQALLMMNMIVKKLPLSFIKHIKSSMILNLEKIMIKR